jgi:hypothetical protein
MSDEQLHHVGFYSKKFLVIKINYETHDKDFLAIQPRCIITPLTSHFKTRGHCFLPTKVHDLKVGIIVIYVDRKQKT